MTDTSVELSSLIPAIEKVDINHGPSINIVEPEKNRSIKRKNTSLDDPVARVDSLKPKSRVAPLLNAALSPTTPSIDKVIPDDPYLHDGNSPGLIPPNHSIHSPLIQRRPQHVDHFTAAELEYRNEIRSLEQRRSIKRLNAIKELMETEETYSRDLNILCTFFFKAIKESQIISEEEYNILVRNSMDILTFQESFTKALRDAHGDEKEERNGIYYHGNLKKISQCFVQWGPKLEIYLDYCVRQDHATSVYNELLQTNADFANLIEQLHNNHKTSSSFSRLKLEDYLIIPFQRIFRYRLLLQNITKATQKDSEEYQGLSQAQNIIHGIVTRLNNEKSKMEAQRKTSLFLSRLYSDWCLPKRWFSTLGVCRLIGTLEVRSLDDTKTKRIGCALFNHYMIMAKAKKHQQYEPKYWFPLRKFDIENLPDMEGSMVCSWLLKSDEHTLELSALCEQEKTIWVEALSKTIEKSKDLYSNSIDSNEYLLEQLFVSSFDQKAQSKAPDTNIDADAQSNPDSIVPVHYPMPTGSSSYSHSTVFSKTSRLSIQSYHPGYNVHDYPGPEDSVKSPSMKSQSSISDLRDFFSNSSVAEKWTQRKCNQYHERCKSIDNKFGDVCTTPILTARSHHNARTESMRRRKGAARLSSASSSIYGKSGMVTEFSSSVLDNASIASSSTMDEPTPLPPISPYPHTVQQQRRHNTESMIFKLLQRNSSFVSLCSSRESLPPLNLTRRNKFFGKIVEKFGQIGGPKYSRHMESEISSPMSTKSFVQRNTSEHSFGSKKKFFPQFFHTRNIKK